MLKSGPAATWKGNVLNKINQSSLKQELLRAFIVLTWGPVEETLSMKLLPLPPFFPHKEQQME